MQGKMLKLAIKGSGPFGRILKIDVEGSELDVLKTIGFNLKNCRIVFIEIMRENKSEVYDLLKNFNLLPIIESKEDIGNYVFKKTNL